MMEYPEFIETLAVTNAALAQELKDFHGVSQVVDWMQRSGLAQTAVDMVAQDEFEYDFLIRLESGGRWLCFGVT